MKLNKIINNYVLFYFTKNEQIFSALINKKELDQLNNNYLIDLYFEKSKFLTIENLERKKLSIYLPKELIENIKKTKFDEKDKNKYLINFITNLDKIYNLAPQVQSNENLMQENNINSHSRPNNIKEIEKPTYVDIVRKGNGLNKTL